MKITIDTDVLKKYNLTIQEFLVMLIGYYSLNYEQEQTKLIEKKLVEKNLFHSIPPVLSDNSKKLVHRVLIESDAKLQSCPLSNYEELAKALQALYPSGIKSGTTYHWQGDADDIAQRLRTLVVRHNFCFTIEEACSAVTEYVSSFEGKDKTHMQLLQNFILSTRRTEGYNASSSMFMTIIENNRESNVQDNQSGNT